MRATRWVQACFLALAALDCGTDGAGGGRTTGDAGDAGDAAVLDPGSCSAISKTQGPSEACCPGYGIDACGAGLFCAAFDGRTQATCYVDGSRADQTECSDDHQCTSGSCNATERKCRSLPGFACTSQTGCAAAMGQSYVCVGGTCTRSNGEAGAPCATATDCSGGRSCSAGHLCVGADGAPCDATKPSESQCTAGLCCTSSSQCGACGVGVGESCGIFGPFCQPGLSCCPLDGGSSGISYYCYASCL